MKRILFIEDKPEIKLDIVLLLLNRENLSFEYEVAKSMNTAKRYLADQSNQVDLVVTDLGLPEFDDGSIYESTKGMDVFYYLKRFKRDVPVIVYSSTFVPNFAERTKENREVKKTDDIFTLRDMLLSFLKE